MSMIFTPAQTFGPHRASAWTMAFEIFLLHYTAYVEAEQELEYIDHNTDPSLSLWQRDKDVAEMQLKNTIEKAAEPPCSHARRSPAAAFRGAGWQDGGQRRSENGAPVEPRDVWPLYPAVSDCGYWSDRTAPERNAASCSFCCQRDGRAVVLRLRAGGRRLFRRRIGGRRVAALRDLTSVLAHHL